MGGILSVLFVSEICPYGFVGKSKGEIGEGVCEGDPRATGISQETKLSKSMDMHREGVYLL